MAGGGGGQKFRDLLSWGRGANYFLALWEHNSKRKGMFLRHVGGGAKFFQQGGGGGQKFSNSIHERGGGALFLPINFAEPPPPPPTWA